MDKVFHYRLARQGKLEKVKYVKIDKEINGVELNGKELYDEFIRKVFLEENIEPIEVSVFKSYISEIRAMGHKEKLEMGIELLNVFYAEIVPDKANIDSLKSYLDTLTVNEEKVGMNILGKFIDVIFSVENIKDRTLLNSCLETASAMLYDEQSGKELYNFVYDKVITEKIVKAADSGLNSLQTLRTLLNEKKIGMELCT